MLKKTIMDISNKIKKVNKIKKKNKNDMQLRGTSDMILFISDCSSYK